VPFAFEAITSENVTGDITPRSLMIHNDRHEIIPVIDSAGRWIGDPTGLQGPIGPPGEPWADRPTGPTGCDRASGRDRPTGAAGCDRPTGAAG
jgi:hypothetical protein